jgi:CRISPR-associated protein Cmr4
MNHSTVYLYLIAPLHTGATSQEGNLLGIARESHTEIPYVPSSTIRGKLRSLTSPNLMKNLWGNTIDDVTSGGDLNLTSGALWVGDASVLWIPVPSLSHGVVWISSPLLLRRWARLNSPGSSIPSVYSTNIPTGKSIYLKDAILKASDLILWDNSSCFIPIPTNIPESINKVLILPDQHCATMIQMSLWRQVKIRLDEHKTVIDNGFRYEEAIPPDTLMYFPWGVTAQTNGNGCDAAGDLRTMLTDNPIMQIGGQESLGRGFVQQWVTPENEVKQ